jgi:hypothetical protein
MSPHPRDAGRELPHTALVYSDWNHRNKLIDSTLKGFKVRWSETTILSAQPELDARFFGRRARKEAARGHRAGPKTYDIMEFLRRPDASDGIVSLAKATLKHAQGASRPVIIGDWTHLRYDDFGVVLETERKENEASLPAICCYRQEGFCSLDPKQIIGVLDNHHRTYFGSTIFESAR